MKVISSGIPLRKDVSDEVRRWLKESEEQKLKLQQERERKKRELPTPVVSAAR